MKWVNTPIQRLSIVGCSGMGALCYVPETYIGEEKSLPELDDLPDGLQCADRQ